MQRNKKKKKKKRKKRTASSVLLLGGHRKPLREEEWADHKTEQRFLKQTKPGLLRKRMPVTLRIKLRAPERTLSLQN